MTKIKLKSYKFEIQLEQLYLRLAHEGYPTNWISMLVLHSDGKGKAIFTEGVEIEGELVTRFSNRDQVTSKLQMLGFAFKNLYVS